MGSGETLVQIRVNRLLWKNRFFVLKEDEEDDGGAKVYYKKTEGPRGREKLFCDLVGGDVVCRLPTGEEMSNLSSSKQMTTIVFDFSSSSSSCILVAFPTPLQRDEWMLELNHHISASQQQRQQQERHQVQKHHQTHRLIGAVWASAITLPIVRHQILQELPDEVGFVLRGVFDFVEMQSGSSTLRVKMEKRLFSVAMILALMIKDGIITRDNDAIGSIIQVLAPAFVTQFRNVIISHQQNKLDQVDQSIEKLKDIAKEVFNLVKSLLLLNNNVSNNNNNNNRSSSSNSNNNNPTNIKGIHKLESLYEYFSNDSHLREIITGSVFVEPRDSILAGFACFN